MHRELHVYPPATVTQVVLRPGSVTGGAQSILQITLSRAAVHPGVRVDLRNSRPTDITHVPHLTVPPGKSDAAATVGTTPVVAAILTEITASVATANSMSTTLTVQAAAKQMLAASCAAGSDCASGQCADGVCCSSTCTGTCRSCSLGAMAGTCAAHAAGTDPGSRNVVPSAALVTTGLVGQYLLPSRGHSSRQFAAATVPAIACQPRLRAQPPALA
ncbi:MAG: hypothetical protein IPF84_15200 [Proteobacteria bacterium]|nr:hypothetical protein [Pseudomonadota bacterium]